MIDPHARPILQQRLSCGIDLLAEPMPGYHTTTLVVRMLGGMSSEPEAQLGLAYILEQTLDKGCGSYEARAFADALDHIGARLAFDTGRQSWVAVLSTLPEFMPQAIALLGQALCQPAFAEDAVQTALSLAHQEVDSLEDEPRELLRRQMARQAFGPLLGRHVLGTHETLEGLDARAVRALWQRVLTRSGLSVSIAGNFDVGAVRDALERAFGDVPEGPPGAVFLTQSAFGAARTHLPKDLEQTQIGLSFPGVTYDHPEFAVERLIIGVLSGGMGARLFTEVREKLGLVYWVRAWHDQARDLGMVHLAAATTAARCQQTYDTLLREIERLAEDLTEEELERAKIGILSEASTAGASVYRRAAELISDHFYLGRAVPQSEKNAAVRAVTTQQIGAYLRRHPRSALSVVTVGTQPLAES